MMPWYFPPIIPPPLDPDAEPNTERQPDRRPTTPPEYWTRAYPRREERPWTGRERKEVRGYDYP